MRPPRESTAVVLSALSIVGGVQADVSASPATAPALPAELWAALKSGERIPRSFTTLFRLEEHFQGRYQTSTWAMRFRERPRASWMELIESNHVPKGLVLLNRGDGKVTLRLPPPASFVKFDVGDRNSQSRSLMGLYPDDVSPDKFLACLQDPANQTRSLGTRVQDGLTLHLVEVRGPRTIVPGATLIIGIAEEPLFPLYTELRHPKGGSVKQTATRFQVRRLTDADFAL